MTWTTMRVFRPTGRSTPAIGSWPAREQLYDKLGRVYRTKTYAVNPTRRHGGQRAW